MNNMDAIGIYIANPTTDVLKPIYVGSKTMVNNAHIKVGKSEGAFKGRKKDYEKTFDGEIEFYPFAIFKGNDKSDLIDIEKAMHVFLRNKFETVGRSREWYDTNDRILIEKYLRDYLSGFEVFTVISDAPIKYSNEQIVTPVIKTNSSYSYYSEPVTGLSMDFKSLNHKIKTGAENISKTKGFLQVLYAVEGLLYEVIKAMVTITYSFIMMVLTILYAILKTSFVLTAVIVFGIISICFAVIGVNVKAGMLNSVINSLDKD